MGICNALILLCCNILIIINKILIYICYVLLCKIIYTSNNDIQSKDCFVCRYEDYRSSS